MRNGDTVLRWVRRGALGVALVAGMVLARELVAAPRERAPALRRVSVRFGAERAGGHVVDGGVGVALARDR